MTDKINESIKASEDLDRVWDNLMLDGLEDQAGLLQGMRDSINGVIKDLGEGNESWLPFGTGGIEVPAEVRTGIARTFALAFEDARVDSEAFFEWINAEIARIGDDPDAQMAFLRSLADPSILIQFRAQIDLVATALGLLSGASDAAAEAIAALNRAAGGDFASGMIAGAQAAADAGVVQLAALQNFNDATIAYLENGDNILDWWLAFDAAANQGAASFSGTQEQYEEFLAATEREAEFRALVDLADDLDNAGESLDRILNVFSQIDALGQRSESAGSIAEALVGEPGVWDEIDDMLAAGTISQQQYNEAVTAGHEIQRSNLRVQEDLNSMRRDQLPLLAEEQAAYEAQVQSISELGPLEQRRALAMQDSAVQSQLAAQYATAYSASIGEIPTEVATNMIVSAAEADPVLKDLLLQFERGGR